MANNDVGGQQSPSNLQSTSILHPDAALREHFMKIDEYTQQLFMCKNSGDFITSAALAGLIEEQWRLIRYILTDVNKKQPPGEAYRKAVGDDVA